MGDTGAAGIVSVAARTFENVTYERTAIWLRDNSVTVVFDQLTSTEVQPYEWYLHPVGKLLSDHDNCADLRRRSRPAWHRVHSADGFQIHDYSAGGCKRASVLYRLASRL